MFGIVLLAIVPVLFPSVAFAAASATYLEKNAVDFADKTSKKYGEMINVAALLHDYDPNLLLAIIVVESEGRNTARSHKGAQGLMQLMPATAKSMGAKDPKDPLQNILAGAKYLRALEQEYGFQSTKEALVAYNMGPTRARRWLSQYAPTEYTYVDRVLLVQRLLDERDTIAGNSILADNVLPSNGGEIGKPRALSLRPRPFSLSNLPIVLPSGRRDPDTYDE